jgi:hypothetical protein
VQSSLGFDGVELDLADFWDMLAEITFVDVLHVGPIVFDCDLFELGAVLVVPGAVVPSLLLGEGTGAGDVVFSAVTHLDVLGDEVAVGYSGVAFNDGVLLVHFAGGNEGEVTAFDLAFYEAVEEGEGDVIVLLVFEVPVDPVLLLYFEVLEHAQIYVHCDC